MTKSKGRRSRKDAEEFLVNVELYVSAATTLPHKFPKPQPKKSEKRIAEGNNLKKVKEKASRANLAKTATENGQWRPATCKLSEEDERCLLTIYVDEIILYQTLYVHLLKQSDIRQADPSLFFRKHCLGIYSVVGQSWSSNNTTDPVYLQFPDSNACNTWLTLLRSYAMPEIYGRFSSPADDGSFRMWRQVELHVIQGRNLGQAQQPESMEGEPIDPSTMPVPIDVDISCEIHFNETLCGRTTGKKGIGNPDWHESFTFNDLPPFSSLDIKLWQEKKMSTPTILGTVSIPLTNFRRREAIDGWFPVLQPGAMSSDIRVGDLRLEIKVHEEIILPLSCYDSLMKTLGSRNALKWLSDFDLKLGLKALGPPMLSVLIANSKLIEDLQQCAAREIKNTPTSRHVVFRGNTVFTQMMERSMMWYGQEFLECSVGPVLRRLCAEKVAIEVDPNRTTKSAKEVKRNMDTLIHWCREFWDQISSAKTECPREIRCLLGIIRQLVEERAEAWDAPDLPWQSVSAFCFLRFIVPAILHPHLFKLCPGHPPPPVSRSLTLIAKVIMSMASLNTTAGSETFMSGISDFVKDSRTAMIDYLLVVSTATEEDDNTLQGTTVDDHDRRHLLDSLLQRVEVMPVLDREALPSLPNLLDVPRDLAIITSAVVCSCSSKDDVQRRSLKDGPDQLINEFVHRCLEVEEEATRRVGHVAKRMAASRKQGVGT